MSKPTKQTPKSRLFAEIVARQTQVAAIEAKELKLKALKRNQDVLESERALLVAIDNYKSWGIRGLEDAWVLQNSLTVARALLERIVKEQVHA